MQDASSDSNRAFMITAGGKGAVLLIGWTRLGAVIFGQQLQRFPERRANTEHSPHAFSPTAAILVGQRAAS